METINIPPRPPHGKKIAAAYLAGFFLFPIIYGLSMLINIAALRLYFSLGLNIPRVLAIPFNLIIYYPVITFGALLALLFVRKAWRMAMGMLVFAPVALIGYYLIAMMSLGQGSP